MVTGDLRLFIGGILVQSLFRPWSDPPTPAHDTINLSRQFLTAAGVIIVLSMIILGTWLTEQLKRSVLRTAAGEGAGFMTNILEPFVQGIGPDGLLPGTAIAELNKIYQGPGTDAWLVAIKIWRPDGMVLYSTHAADIGQTFDSSEVRRALGGEVVVEFESSDGEESQAQGAEHAALIEIYGPLRRTGTRQVVAVGELYQDGGALRAELADSQFSTWGFVLGTSVVMTSILFFIVRRGSAIIAEQRLALSEGIDDASRMAAQNEGLRIVADKARLDASEANEQLLARIGSDLHDGPIQMLSLIILKLSAPPDETGSGKENAGLLALAGDVLVELRNLSAGLTLPEIADISLEEAIRLAVFRHIDRTGDSVTLELQSLPSEAVLAVKICGYRVIQEALNNAHRHARGSQQYVSARVSDDALLITVSDDGTGLETAKEVGARPRLGLAGIRTRAAALKGSVVFTTSAAEGTRVSVSLPLEN